MLWINTFWFLLNIRNDLTSWVILHPSVTRILITMDGKTLLRPSEMGVWIETCVISCDKLSTISLYFVLQAYKKCMHSYYNRKGQNILWLRVYLKKILINTRCQVLIEGKSDRWTWFCTLFVHIWARKILCKPNRLMY